MIEHGRIRLTEIGKLMCDGEVFGEVGLFAPQNVRTLSARCDSDCRLHTITRQKVLELYYQDPKFGFSQLRLVSGIADKQEVAGGGRPRVAAQ